MQNVHGTTLEVAMLADVYIYAISNVNQCLTGPLWHEPSLLPLDILEPDWRCPWILTILCGLWVKMTIFQLLRYSVAFLYARRKTGRIMESPCPSVRLFVRLSTIACERDILKIACRIDFTFWYGLNTTKTSDAIDLRAFYENQDGRHSSLKINIVPYAGYCLWTRYLENRLSDWLHILIWP